MDFNSYKNKVENQLNRLGLAYDDIKNILESTEGQSILRINYRSDVSPSSCIDDILVDAPDYIMSQLNG